MSVPAKLAAFVAGLALVLAAGYGAGRAVGSGHPGPPKVTTGARP